jgi:hypothetical protein
LTEEVFALFQAPLLLKKLHTVASPARPRGELEELLCVLKEQEKILSTDITIKMFL